MFRGIIYCILLCVNSLIASTVSIPQSTHPTTVLDYYLLLPEKYFEANRELRANWMLDPKRGAIVDTKNGYLYAAGDGAQTDIYVCLFKRVDGTYLIGVKSHPGDTSEYTHLEFYIYKDGVWKDVTKHVLPISVNDELRYEMPRYGTKIKVTSRKGKRLYDLVWRKEAFKLKRY